MSTLQTWVSGGTRLTISLRRYMPETCCLDTVAKVIVTHNSPLQSALHVQYIWVKPAYRRLGLAKVLLLEAAIRYHKAKRITTLLLHQRSRRVFVSAFNAPIRGAAQARKLGWKTKRGAEVFCTFQRPATSRLLKRWLAQQAKVDANFSK